MYLRDLRPSNWFKAFTNPIFLRIHPLSKINIQLQQLLPVATLFLVVRLHLAFLSLYCFRHSSNSWPSISINSFRTLELKLCTEWFQWDWTFFCRASKMIGTITCRFWAISSTMCRLFHKKRARSATWNSHLSTIRYKAWLHDTQWISTISVGEKWAKLKNDREIIILPNKFRLQRMSIGSESWTNHSQVTL